MPGQGLVPLIGILLLVGGADAPQTIIKPATAPAPGTKHYQVQVRILEVDEQGRVSVIASPTVQTTGAAAGVTIDTDRGSRFEFHFSATEPGAPSPLPVVLADDAVVPKPIAVTSSTTIAIDHVKTQRITLQATKQPRKVVLREMARQAGLKLVIEPDAVAAATPWLTTPVSVDYSNTPLEQALGHFVGPSKLGYTLEAGLLVIGSEVSSTEVAITPAPAAAPADGWLVKVYDVSDLVMKDSATGRADFTPLIAKLRGEVLPKSWEEDGGKATIRGFDSTVSLVIRQTPAGHTAVVRFLETQRTKQP